MWILNFLLGLDIVSSSKRQAMATAIRALKEVRDDAVTGYKTDRFLADADWDLVKHHVEIKDPYTTVKEEVYYIKKSY